MSLRFDLKNKTAIFHQLAEKSAMNHHPLDSLRGYAKFLNGMYRVYSRYSTILDASSKTIDLEQRSLKIKTCLKNDITSLRLSLPQIKEEKLSEKNFSKESLLGVAYVFEGSALGSQVLLERLKIKFPNASTSSSYLKLLSDQSPYRWKHTIKILSLSQNSSKEAVSSASDVFKSISEIMETVE